MRRLRWIVVLGIAGFATACQAAATPAPGRSFQLQTLNDSGVSGTVTLQPTGADRTLVTVAVSFGDNADMPAHIHPGSCTQLVPQPRFPLENVKNGQSSTTVAVPMTDLLRGDLAVNLHRSPDDMRTYTACVDLR